MYHPLRPYAIDLAASSTWGVSTLLCRTAPPIRQVISLREARSEKWNAILDRYLHNSSTSLIEFVNVEGPRAAFDSVSDPQAPLLILAAANDAAKQQPSAVFESWLELAPQTVIVLLGVGKTGDSSPLACLTARCIGSSYRLALPRELAAALVESRLALVSRRDNVAFDSILVRISHVFANHFPFLDLIKRMCSSALEESVVNEPLSNLRAGVLEPQSLITPYDLRLALLERERELQEVRKSLIFRMLQGIRRLTRFPRRARMQRPSQPEA